MNFPILLKVKCSKAAEKKRIKKVMTCGWEKITALGRGCTERVSAGISPADLHPGPPHPSHTLGSCQ